MSNYSNFIKSMNEKDEKWFFGDTVEHTSNKYFKFNRIVDENNIIILTNNIKVLKGNYVLLVDNNKGVYLKDWQVRKVHNFDYGVNTYAVKLNKNYFKPYTFNFNFDDMAFEKEDTFETLVEVANEQNAENVKVAKGWMQL